MTKEDFYLVQNKLMNKLSPKVDHILEKAEISPVDKDFSYAHGRAVGALDIYNEVTSVLISLFDELEKEGVE